MARVRLSLLIGLTIVLLHAIVPHSHPWESEHGSDLPLRADAQSDPTCSLLPVGAVAPAPPPIWCLDPPETGPSTFTQGANSWLDQFDHHLSTASLGAGYQVFDREGSSINRAQHWRHNEHWMVDVSGQDADGPPPWNFGGAMMRPDRSFRFEQGKLVVEADVAAGIADYGGDAWPELVVSTSPAPTSQVDDLYAYGNFKGFWTVGCRLQSSRSPICAMYDDTGRGAGSGGRRFEISSFQSGGAAQKYGGGPFTPQTDLAWRVCRGTDPDTNCRDRFRWELTRDTLTLYVNGVLYMQHQGLPPNAQLPDAMLNGDVYVYFADWIFKPDAQVVRFHWDRVAVNPGTPPGPAPGVPTCSPRPPVRITTARAGAGRLQVTVTAGLGSMPSLRFTRTNNALVDVAGQTGRSGAFTVQLPTGVQQQSFVVRRVNGGAAATVNLVVTDVCGDWSTFVGGGPGAF